MKKFSSTFRGFTLIELLVTIAIIALLSGILMTSLAPSKGKARDAKRISDLGNIQLALELYFDRCKVYPALITGDLSTIKNGRGGSQCSANLGNFISVMPTPPSPGAATYNYATLSNFDTGDVVGYVLRVNLESDNEVRKDSLKVFPTAVDPYEWNPPTLECNISGSYYYYCLSGK